jgi:DNA-binding MarR family transcriptional regulator
MPVQFMTVTGADTVTRIRVALGRLARQLNTTAAASGLSPTQLSVLASIVKYGPVGMSDLAKVEAVNATMLSRVVGKMEVAGLVTREADAADGRCLVVRVTPTGRATHRRVRDEKSRMLALHLQRLPADQSALIVEALPALEALVLEMRAARETR